MYSPLIQPYTLRHQESLAFFEHPTKNEHVPFRYGEPHASFVFPPHYHKEIEIIYVYHGDIELEVSHNTYQLKQGDLLIIGSHHIHAYAASKTPDSRFAFLLIDWEYFNKIYSGSQLIEALYPLLYQVNHLSHEQLLTAQINEKLLNNLEGFQKEMTNKDLAYQLKISALIYNLFVDLCRHPQLLTVPHVDAKALAKENRFLKSLNAYIAQHYQEGFTLSDAAIYLGYSPYHFTRTCKKFTGMGFKQYATAFQLAMSKEALMTKDITITEVAFSCGFKSIKTFNRLFHDAYNCSPSEFKHQRR